MTADEVGWAGPRQDQEGSLTHNELVRREEDGERTKRRRVQRDRLRNVRLRGRWWSESEMGKEGADDEKRRGRAQQRTRA